MNAKVNVNALDSNMTSHYDDPAVKAFIEGEAEGEELVKILKGMLEKCSHVDIRSTETINYLEGKFIDILCASTENIWRLHENRLCDTSTHFYIRILLEELRKV